MKSVMTLVCVEVFRGKEGGDAGVVKTSSI